MRKGPNYQTMLEDILEMRLTQEMIMAEIVALKQMAKDHEGTEAGKMYDDMALFLKTHWKNSINKRNQ